MDTQQKYKDFVMTGFMKAVEPIVVDRAKGATYYAEDGREYIDCFAGISVANAGHGNEAVVKAAKAQMDKLVHCNSYVYHVKPVADLAEKLAKITPGKLKKTFFGNGGAEAIEGAMRLAKRYTTKSEMIALTHSFHGRSLATLSITGNAGRKRGGAPYLPGVAFAPSPYSYRSPLYKGDDEAFGKACAEALDEVIKYHTSDDVAFFIAEPVQGEGGIVVPPPNYFKEVKKVLDHHKILFIADEVQTGFCRTGKMFGIDHYGVEPDIMVMAKGIAGGFPLSAFTSRDEIADAFKPGDHLSTFGGNPVSCAAALANIEFLEKDKVGEQAEKKGAFFKDLVSKIKPKNVMIGEVRGKGLMIGIELVKDKDKTPAADESGKIRGALRDQGILTGLGGALGNVIRIQPPLTISEDDLGKVAAALKKVLEA